LESQFDQEVYIAERLARHGAGIRMKCDDTSPELLAETILENLGREATWKSIPTDGAKKVACFIMEMLGK